MSRRLDEAPVQFNPPYVRATVRRAAQAAASFEREGIETELLDVRSLQPHDWSTFEQSVRKTGRALVVHE